MKINEFDGSLPAVLAAMETAWASHPHRYSEADEALLKRLNKVIALEQIATGSKPDRLEVPRDDFHHLIDVMSRVPGYDGEYVDGEWEDDLTRPIARNQLATRASLSEQGVDNVLYRGCAVTPVE